MSVRIQIPSPPKEAPPPPSIAPVNDTMRRLQIGIAGVLTVLLLVGMAGLIGDPVRLREGGMPVKDVARRTGYPSPSALRAALRRQGS